MRSAVALLAAGAALVVPVAARAQVPPVRVLVMPFENVTREPRILWLGEAAAVILVDHFNAAGASAITRDERREAFERLRVPPASALTDATVIRIGQLLGAGQAIVGTVRLDGEELVVQARSIGLEAGRIVAQATERGPLPDLFALVERVAGALLPADRTTDARQPRERPPLPAFESYIKGLLAETPATAISYLDAALERYPAYVRPRLAQWLVHTEQGDHERALDAVEPVPAGSPWSRRARFLAALSHVSLQHYDSAYALFSGLSDERLEPAVLNNLGVVQMRRGSTPQTGKATYFFNRAAELDRNDPDYFFNLGYAYWFEEDTQAAIYWLREAVRRDPADGDAHFVLAAALSAAGNTGAATRERELARRLSATYEAMANRPGEPVPPGLERLKSGIDLPSAIRPGSVDAVTLTGQRDQQELGQFYLDRGRRLFEQVNDREALAELNRVLFLSPYSAEAHLLVGRIHLRNGRLPDAIDAFKISLWSEETSAGHLALATAYLEADEEDNARVEARRALELAPESSDAQALLDRIGP